MKYLPYLILLIFLESCFGPEASFVDSTETKRSGQKNAADEDIVGGVLQDDLNAEVDSDQKSGGEDDDLEDKNSNNQNDENQDVEVLPPSEGPVSKEPVGDDNDSSSEGDMCHEDPAKDEVETCCKEGDDLGIPGGHFDLDTSSHLYEFNEGSTDGHVHEYDDKFGLAGADFLSLKDSKLINLQDKLSSNQKFRIILANTSLSPMGTLSINGIETNVVEFQRQSNLQDVYSMEGLDGTIKLEGFSIGFPSDTFAKNGLIPTATGCVRNNKPGKNGEYRNGALVIQVVNADAYTVDSQSGLLTSGLIWEAALFWHRDKNCYD